MTADLQHQPDNAILYVPARSRRSFWFADCLFTVLVTGEESAGSYTTMELLVPPGKGPGLHLHPAEEEQFYVLGGDLTFWIGEHTFQVSAGDFLHIPRQTPHGFTNGDRPSRLLATFSPAGPERHFMDGGVWLADGEADPWLAPQESGGQVAIDPSAPV